MPRIELHNIGSIGLNSDLPPHQLPPEAWNNSRNLRFREGNIEPRFGTAPGLTGEPLHDPYYVLALPTPNEYFWLYLGLDAASVYAAGVHTDITRAGGPYTTASPWQWSSTVLGGIPIFNNGLDIPQFWNPPTDSTNLADLTNWPTDVRAKVVRAFGPYLIALNITDSGAFPHMFWWSHPTDPGAIPNSWDYTDPAFDAGRRELTDVEGGELLDGLMLRGNFIMYKENSTHSMRFIGGQNIFATDLAFASSGILATRCVAVVNKGQQHFVATRDDVIVFNGQGLDGKLSSKLKKKVFNEIDSENYRSSFCFHNQQEDEAWFAYPEAGATRPTKALIWNYKDNTWDFRDMPVHYVASGRLGTTESQPWDSLTNTWDENTQAWNTPGEIAVVAAAGGDGFVELEIGYTFDGSPVPFFAERQALAIIGKDRQGNPKYSFTAERIVTRIWPKMSGSNPISFRVGFQETPDEAIFWSDAQVFDPSSDRFVDFEISGRLLAIRVEGTTATAWRLEGYDITLELLGEY